MKKQGLSDAAIKAGRPLVAALYSRVSKDVRGDQRSVEDQDEENRAACADEDWKVGETYCDNDTSASRFSKKARPDWDRLLEDLAARRFEVLVLWESSRGDRKLGRWIYLLDLCRDLGVLIHITSHDRTYDVRKRRDYKTLAEEGLDSADDSEKTSDRLRRDKRKVAQKGLPHGRHLYGYKRVYDIGDNGRRRLVEIVPDEDPREATAADGTVTTYTPAGVVREVVSRLASGDSIRNVTVDLNQRGIPSPRNGSGGWRSARLRDIGTNPAYIARRVHQGQVLAGVEAAWPPLVDEGTFRACNARLNAPGRKVHREGAIRHLLTWLAVCGVCGHTVRRMGSVGDPRYVCDPGDHADSGYCVSRRISHVDAYVQMAVWERLARPDIAELLLQDRRSDERYSQLEAEIAEKQERITAAREAAARGQIGFDDLAEIRAILEPEIKAARGQMERQRIAPVLRGLVGVTPEQIEAEWWSRSIEQRREVIRVLTEKVVILPLGARKRYEPHESVDIVWRKSA